MGAFLFIISSLFYVLRRRGMGWIVRDKALPDNLHKIEKQTTCFLYKFGL